MKALELDYGQTLFVQQEEKDKEKKLATQQLQEANKQEQLKIQNEKAKKEKIENFIQNREEAILELIPSFIESNKFLLQQAKLDLENHKEILKVIK